MKKFREKFRVTENIENNKIDDQSYFKENGFLFLKEIINTFGGNIYNHGVFKIHTFEYVQIWTGYLKNYFIEEFPKFDMLCFASNWQGIMYCINSTNSKIVYFDPATCEFFEAEFSIIDFFDKILVEGEYDIIFEEYFNETREFMKFNLIQFDKSIGHIIYLHLGGQDDVDNLEIVDTEVLWETQIEVANRINEIPD